jgi:hypothetical protein
MSPFKNQALNPSEPFFSSAVTIFFFLSNMDKGYLPKVSSETHGMNTYRCHLGREIDGERYAYMHTTFNAILCFTCCF